jgi:transposase
VARDLC